MLCWLNLCSILICPDKYAFDNLYGQFSPIQFDWPRILIVGSKMRATISKHNSGVKNRGNQIDICDRQFESVKDRNLFEFLSWVIKFL
jgi:hypothetical protein